MTAEISYITTEGEIAREQFIVEDFISFDEACGLVERDTVFAIAFVP